MENAAAFVKKSEGTYTHSSTSTMVNAACWVKIDCNKGGVASGVFFHARLSRAAVIFESRRARKCVSRDEEVVGVRLWKHVMMRSGERPCSRQRYLIYDTIECLHAMLFRRCSPHMRRGDAFIECSF
jgi:hypothetical protein